MGIAISHGFKISKIISSQSSSVHSIIPVVCTGCTYIHATSTLHVYRRKLMQNSLPWGRMKRFSRLATRFLLRRSCQPLRVREDALFSLSGWLFERMQSFRKNWLPACCKCGVAGQRTLILDLAIVSLSWSVPKPLQSSSNIWLYFSYRNLPECCHMCIYLHLEIDANWGRSSVYLFSWHRRWPLLWLKTRSLYSIDLMGFEQM